MTDEQRVRAQGPAPRGVRLGKVTDAFDAVDGWSVQARTGSAPAAGGARVVSMPDRSRKQPVKRPRDLNSLARMVIDEATSDEPRHKPEERVKDPAAVALGRKGGLKGGRARAESLSPQDRSEIAKKAAAARWGKR